MASYELQPYVSAGPLRFGMHPDEVQSALKQVPEVGENSLGEIDAVYDDVSVRFDPDALTAVEIAFVPWKAEVVYRGVPLSGPRGIPDPVPVLLQDDPQPLVLFGFLVFPKLGLALTGYHDGDASQRSITAFTRGRWDAYLDQASPFVR
jgi:hypothetical protein